MELYDSMATVYVPDLKVVSVELPLNGALTPDFLRSDHASFWARGYKALMLTDGADFRNLNYHTPADTIGALNFTFMSNIVKATVASLCALAKIQNSTSATKQVDGPVQVREFSNDCSLHVSYGWLGKYLFLSTSCEVDAWSALQVFNSEGKLATTFSIAPGTEKIRLPANLSAGVYVAVMRGKQYHATKRFVVID